MRQLTHGGLFSGIAGFGLGFHRARFKTLWEVEKEPFCQAVLRTHFPEVEIFSDVHDCGKHNLRAVDVITAGFPCQDLSVAGKRAGLGGHRSGLFWQAVRIVGEIRPRWFVLENVPGLFSSNEGRDFAAVLRGLGELGHVQSIAWTVLNSQYFGVAQRRRRVFIVCSTSVGSAEQVLFELSCGQGDFETSGEERSGLAFEIAASLRVSGEPGSRGHTFDAEAGLAVYHENISGSITGEPHARSLRSGASHSYQTVAQPLSASNGHHGHSRPRGDGSDNLVPTLHAGMGHHGWAVGNQDFEQLQPIAIQDVCGMRDKKQNGIGLDYSGGPMYTLDGTSEHAVAAPVRQWRSGDSDGKADLYVGTPSDSDRVRDFAGLPSGLDSARYRALGNAVTVQVSTWIAQRIKSVIESQDSEETLKGRRQ